MPLNCNKSPHQSPELKVLIEQAGPKLKELLVVPFNLRLLADLLNKGVDVEELTPIRTQLELLEKLLVLESRKVR